MQIVAVLEPSQLILLRRALIDAGAIVTSVDPQEPFSEAKLRGAHALVVNPLAVSRQPLDVFIERAEALRLPKILIVPRKALGSIGLLHLIRGATRVFIDEDEDAAARLYEFLRRPRSEYSAHLVQSLEPSMERLPRAIRASSLRVLICPEQGDCPKRLAGDAGVTRRTLDRWNRRAGISSAWALVTGARLAQTIPDLLDPSIAIRETAEKWGYPSRRALVTHCIELVDRPPERIRSEMDGITLVNAIARRILCRPDEDS